MFKGIYQRPAEARKAFAERGWTTVAALQLRNPMHNSHAYLAWIAIEVCDGVYIHQLVGKLKPGDIPAEIRVKAIDALVNKYFRKDRVIQGGYPMEMRYAGPREALLHAVFRQNYGCTHLIVGRDHAGVGDYYGPFDAQKIFNEIPSGALLLQPLCMDWTFYCYECGSMASMKTCPHESKAVIDENGKYKGGARLLLSGTLLRKLMSEGKPVPAEFSRPEVIAILKEYYDSLEEKVEVKLHGAATGRSQQQVIPKRRPGSTGRLVIGGEEWIDAAAHSGRKGTSVQLMRKRVKLSGPSGCLSGTTSRTSMCATGRAVFWKPSPPS